MNTVNAKPRSPFRTSTMVGTLVFQSLSAIHEEYIRLLREVPSVECKKERRKVARKFQRHPIVRKCHIIAASAGFETGFSKNLNEDETALKHALTTIPNLKLQLPEFKHRVLEDARYDAGFERRNLEINNSGNQHPDAYPVPDTADEVRRELSFRESDNYLEMGKTYSWYIHRYDEQPPFAGVTTHGRCQNCHEGLPVWRSCRSCAFAHFIDECEDIYVRCMECWSPEHQRDLEEVTKCENCGGPPSLVIEREPEDLGPWVHDEVWDDSYLPKEEFLQD